MAKLWDLPGTFKARVVKFVQIDFDFKYKKKLNLLIENLF